MLSFTVVMEFEISESQIVITELHSELNLWSECEIAN